jgi:hypothetical protein
MKLISFDIGIKNMAYCLFDVDQSVTKIQEWEVLNLMEDKIQDAICNCHLAQKKKSLENAKICGKKAKFQKGQNTYCEKHAKMNTRHIIPVKEISQTALKKMKLDELQTLGKTYEIKDIENSKKPELLSKIVSYFEENCYQPIKIQKQKSASETDLITIGRNMRDKLDEKSWINDLDVVIMENQISPLAGRMKTVQGMLAQYFIMKSVDNIDFVSSANKLKGLTEKSWPRTADNEEVAKRYKKHKTDSIAICSRFLEGNADLEKWKPSLETQKKDDLADGFLQGIWYLKQNNIITYNADDLKINSV